MDCPVVGSQKTLPDGSDILGLSTQTLLAISGLLKPHQWVRHFAAKETTITGVTLIDS